MSRTELARAAKIALKRTLYPLVFRSRRKYRCVICAYVGPFAHKQTPKPLRSRLNAKCPSCSSMERHRFQWQILSDLSPASSRPQQTLLHFAPEPSLEDRLRPQFGEYISADLFRSNVDQRVDVRDMPFSDDTFDIILCSMVLHYVDDYKRALQEIYRVLKPGGFALLPVPMIHEKTNDAPAQNSALRMVVEPGPDFYDLYDEYFDEVRVSVSTDYDDDLHFFLEPTDAHPFPLKLAEQKHADIIPVSFKAGATLDA